MDTKMMILLAKATAGPIRGMMKRMEVRIEALEARVGINSEQKSLADNYHGVWREGNQHQRGHLVTDRGSLWLCLKDNNSRPNGGQSWRLVSKHGKAPERSK